MDQMNSTAPDSKTTMPLDSSERRQGLSLRPGVAVVVGLAVLAAGFYLGNNYQVIWSRGFIPIPSIISSASVGDPLEDPLFGQVQELMRTKYLRASELDKQQMLYGAIAGMVNSAGDPYTAFFDPEQNEDAESQLSGKYSGIGAELGFNKDKQLSVIAPIKDTPAEAAGILAGDVIAKIDDKETQDMSLTEAVSHIRGEEGTEVSLTV